ncbi:proline-rich extensin-like protein EPR1 [Lathyrus oleraceus]|uniref:proline-rich extensin-like protein EPR1 n=1 Tax=Pisum sativum TaxID=3888 RepID=UPI0021D35ABD|nr:proline-rich extensin-like protein EPR1 [Pisum sativum]
MVDALSTLAGDIPSPPLSVNAPDPKIQKPYVNESPKKGRKRVASSVEPMVAKPPKKQRAPSTPPPQVSEEVPVEENEDSDGSVHSHIFSPSKAPPRTPPTPTRQKKAPSQKTPTKVDPRASPIIKEVPTPRDSERTPTASPHIDLQDLSLRQNADLQIDTELNEEKIEWDSNEACERELDEFEHKKEERLRQREAFDQQISDYQAQIAELHKKIPEVEVQKASLETVEGILSRRRSTLRF